MLKLKREKPRVGILLSIVYRFFNLKFWNKKKRMKLLLDLEWMFNRMSLEQSYALYSLEENPIKTKSLNFLLPKIESNFKVLDLGCRRGEISFQIAHKAKEVVGVDHNPMVISDAQKMHPKENLIFVNDDAFNFLEKEEHNFDLLIMSHILEHIDEPSKLLTQFKSFFKFIYIEIPDFDASYLNQFRKDLKVPLIYTDRDHVWEFDREGIIQLFEEQGLSILDSEYRFGVQKYFLKVSKLSY